MLETEQNQISTINDTQPVYTQVCLISHPGLDEIAAKVLIERFLGLILRINRFNDSIDMPDQELLEMEAAGIYLIDLGSNQYKKRSLRSAAEVVAEDFKEICGIDLSENEIKLITLLNQDNETGSLNKYVDQMSIPWTLRKMYEIEPYGNDQSSVVNRVGHVLEIWLRYISVDERDPLRNVSELSEEFPDLMNKLCSNKPDKEPGFHNFTVIRYMRDMWCLGIPAEEIRERVSYWMEAWRKVKEAIAEGEKNFASLTPPPVTFTTSRLNGIVLESGDSFLNRAGLCKCDIIVAKDPETGHALIATHNHKIDRLVNTLTRREPGQWFHVRGWAVNGGLRNRGVTPTKFTSSELVELVRMFV